MNHFHSPPQWRVSAEYLTYGDDGFAASIYVFGADAWAANVFHGREETLSSHDLGIVFDSPSSARAWVETQLQAVTA